MRWKMRSQRRVTPVVTKVSKTYVLTHGYSFNPVALIVTWEKTQINTVYIDLQLNISESVIQAFFCGVGLTSSGQISTTRLN